MSGNTRVNLRKILGWREDVAAWDKQANRPRIHAGRGVAWFDGHGENGKLPDEDEEEKAEKDKTKGGATNGVVKQADEEIKSGDEVQGVEGLQDCESGRCINLRLNGLALPPQGWSSVCRQSDEKPEKTCILEIELGQAMRTGDGAWSGGFGAARRFASPDAAFAAILKHYSTGYPLSDNNMQNIAVNDLWMYKIYNADGSLGWGGYLQAILDKLREAFYTGQITGSTAFAYASIMKKAGSWPYYDQTHEVGRKTSRLKRRICPNNADYEAAYNDMANEMTEKWPENTCSEMVASENGFVAACSGADPHLPSQYATPNQTITLCDGRLQGAHQANG